MSVTYYNRLQRNVCIGVVKPHLHFAGWMCQISMEISAIWVRSTGLTYVPRSHACLANYIENRVSMKSGGFMVVNAKEMKIAAIATFCRFLADIKSMCHKSIAIWTHTVWSKCFGSSVVLHSAAGSQRTHCRYR